MPFARYGVTDPYQGSEIRKPFLRATQCSDFRKPQQHYRCDKG